MRRVLVAAGGTGGHFYPGLVAAQTLRARGWQPLVAVRAGDPAKRRLDEEGIAWVEVDLKGMTRSVGPELLAFASKLAASLGLMSRVARDFRPDLVLGMGGYLTFPAAYAAWRRGIPCALHESNAILGLANAASRRLGARLFWGLPPAGGGAVVGTPVRPELRARRDPGESRRALGLDPGRPTVLAFGGSQGARALNLGLARALASAGPEAQVLHLAGLGKAPETSAAYARAGVAADVREYLDDMAAAYGAADVVVCRSGASTLAELAAQRKPAVLIPYPHAAAGHQDANARVLESAGAALRVPEADMAAALGPALTGLLASAERRAAMGAAYASLGLPPAERSAEALADALERMV